MVPSPPFAIRDCLRRLLCWTEQPITGAHCRAGFPSSPGMEKGSYPRSWLGGVRQLDFYLQEHCSCNYPLPSWTWLSWTIEVENGFRGWGLVWFWWENELLLAFVQSISVMGGWVVKTVYYSQRLVWFCFWPPIRNIKCLPQFRL